MRFQPIRLGYTCRDDVEEARLTLIPDGVARPASDHTEIELRFGRILEYARAALRLEDGPRQQDGVIAARRYTSVAYRGKPIQRSMINTISDHSFAFEEPTNHK